jgi:predicted transcriptional regulators
MSKELFSLADKIKLLREKDGLTQAEVARSLGLSRSGVNAWEMGLSVPSTPYIVELAKMFGVSTDYLLGIEDTSTISVKGLTQKQIAVLLQTIECFRTACEDKDKNRSSL